MSISINSLGKPYPIGTFWNQTPCTKRFPACFWEVQPDSRVSTGARAKAGSLQFVLYLLPFLLKHSVAESQLKGQRQSAVSWSLLNKSLLSSTVPQPLESLPPSSSLSSRRENSRLFQHVKKAITINLGSAQTDSVSTVFCYHRPGERGERTHCPAPLALCSVMERMPAPAAIGISLTNEAVIKHLLGEALGSGGCVLVPELPPPHWSCR